MRHYCFENIILNFGSFSSNYLFKKRLRKNVKISTDNKNNKRILNHQNKLEKTAIILFKKKILKSIE
jgi:hypothetical protein